MTYKAIVIGTSAGGLNALSAILSTLPEDFPLPLLIVQHAAPSNDTFLETHLNRLSSLQVKEAQEKEKIQPGTVYLSPGGYHLLVEDDCTLSLSSDSRVQHSRPSIDVLFESAADVFREALIGVILTGANSDGAHGLKLIKSYGGLVIAQDPETAESSMMPRQAIKETAVDYILPVEEIGPLLCQITRNSMPAQQEGSHEKK
jgi:two-component system, chemotaxis family, protein-glutamate methylesterase/glutaminase